jgi:multiple sugar transport system substrate-binding protein
MLATTPEEGVSGITMRTTDKTVNRRLTRRSFLGLALALPAAAALAGCGVGAVGGNQKPGQKAQLVYQDWRTEWFPAMAQTMLEEFHASHPNIRVFYLPDPENLEEKMPEVMQAGTAPDVFQGCCAHFPVWAQSGYTLDLGPYVRADLDKETIADWDPVQYKALMTREGLQYGLPKYHGALALYYNKDMLDNFGVDYPNETWSHDDYLLAMKKLARDRDGDGQRDLWGSMVDISWDRLQVYVNSWGGHFVDPGDGITCRMDRPEALAAFEWLRARMWDDRVMASLQDTQKFGTSESFSAGRLAMVEDGSWALKAILNAANFRIGVAPRPKGPVARATLTTTDGFGIYAGTRYPEAAWELVKFLIGPQYGRAMASANFLQPARASLYRDWSGYVQQQYPNKAGGLDLSAFLHGQNNGYSVVAEVFAKNMASARQIANNAWARIFTLPQAPVSLLKDACAEIQAAQQQKGGVGQCC